MRTLAILLFVVACSSSSEPEPEPTQGDETPVWTGSVDEDAFMALHQLTDAEAPAPRGEMIVLGESEAYLSLPSEGSAPFPAVLVIHEWWGLNDHIRHWSDRLAELGYAALAVDLYGGETATEPEGAMALMRAVDEERALTTLRAAADFLRDDPRIQATKRASIGWCFGGGWSLRTALGVEGMDAAVMYYGHPVDAEELVGLQVPLLGIFGNEDEAIPPATVDEFDRALTEAGAPHEILRYDAPHAFANPSSARYVHESATEAWARVRTFLAEHLGR